jgi:hypothetical protein
MVHNQELVLGVVFFGVYMFGGIVSFSGLFLVGFMSGQELLGWVEGRSLGYLCICVGFILSLAGILFMNALRKRGCS